MQPDEELIEQLNQTYVQKDGIYLDNSPQGYWSNLSKTDQGDFIQKIQSDNFKEEYTKNYPKYANYIFSVQRTKGLELLNISSDEIGADYGCMWGNILTYAAKKCKLVVGFDKTLDHLLFLKERIKKENLNNVILINKNLQDDINIMNAFDFAIVNGVLEWIPVKEDIEIGTKNKGHSFNSNNESPEQLQIMFLENVYKSLKAGGRLYLAIENRWDYQYFFWKRDPHSQLFYTAFLQRKLSNIISKIIKRKPYFNYLYSVNGFKNILKKIGFSEITPYAVFPDYRYPKIIVPVLSKGLISLNGIYNPLQRKKLIKILFHKARRILDIIIYEKLKMYSLSPSLILIAKK